MYCVKCGTELPDTAYYCGHCGAATRLAPPAPPAEPLMRSATDRKIAGVCGGLARYFAMDSTVMRLIWLLLTFGLPPAGILGYIAAWILMPVEPVGVFHMPRAGSETVS